MTADKLTAAQPVQAGDAVDKRDFAGFFVWEEGAWVAASSDWPGAVKLYRASLAPVSAQQSAADEVPPKREPRNDDPREQAHAAGFNVCRELWLAAKAPAAQAVDARSLLADLLAVQEVPFELRQRIKAALAAPEAMTSEQQPATQQDEDAKDAARLDWIAANPDVRLDQLTRGWTIWNHVTGQTLAMNQPTARAAIDEAMSAHQAKKSEGA